MTLSAVELLCVEWDAAARVPGTAGMSAKWRSTLPPELGGLPFTTLPRELGAILPRIIGTAVGGIVGRGGVPLVLGGDHSITYHVVERLVDVNGLLTVVHFDAHHDAYPGNHLNHYTVFNHIKRRLPVEVVPVGHRWDCDEVASPRLARPTGGCTYVSLDVDYFNPNLVPSVGHAVPPDVDHSCDAQSFSESISLITGTVVGADVVEWHGPSSESERCFVRGRLAELASLLTVAP